MPAPGEQTDGPFQSSGALDAGSYSGQSEQSLERDRSATDAARFDGSIVDAIERRIEGDEVVSGLGEQRRDLGPFVGDGGALGVVLIVVRGELRAVDDAIETLLQAGDLVAHANPFHLDGIA